MKMTNEIQTTSAEATFRAVAADRMVTAANISLHDLLDEFQRLAGIIASERLPVQPDEYGTRYTDAGKLAINELAIVNGSAKVRFGVQFMVCSLNDDF
jgi:hypothetical protein